MSTTLPGGAPYAAEALPAPRRRVSWGAIFAGALIAIAVGTMLNILGLAVGATVVDATNRSTPDASTIGIGASVWLLVANLIGLVVGGYVAARLSGTGDRSDATLHGLSTWATAYLVSAVLLGNVVSGAASTAGSAVSSVMGGLGRAATTAASTAAPQVDTNALVERARAALSGPSDPARMTTEQRGAEISSIVGRRIADGNLSDPDRTRLNQLVAAEAGIPEQEAAQRVQAYEAQAQRTAQEAERRARAAADAAATGTATASFWIFAALLLGALASIIGARMGTRVIAVEDRRYAV
ncbi:hypothetical protein [Roseomonas sp. BN140053]|uniref:hypothetical protein n=1 Tax=Roseomonas sp. BN140053 TaxID=3391898 RepID=UPI0039EB6A54